MTIPGCETHGAEQVTVKLVPFTVAGAMSSENTAETVVLVATPTVGPGVDVAGIVSVTLGRVVSGATPVLKVHTKLLTSVRPVVSVAPVVTVAVQRALAGRLAVGVKVAARLAAVYETVPVTAAPNGQATVKVVALIVAGFMSLLNAAVTRVPLIGTPVALLTGATAVTVGGNGATPPPVPRMGSCPPPPPPQLARRTLNAVARNHGNILEQRSDFFIFFLFWSSRK